MHNMKRVLYTLFFAGTFLLAGTATQAQDTEFKTSGFNLYDQNADPFKQLEQATKQAKADGKHIFIQIGGNWCVWCYRFNRFCTNDPQIDSLIKKDYVVLHVNYSKENKNLPFLEKMEYPQRFGFPVFLILDANGKRLHTQNSALLEDGKGYSKEKIFDFLTQWNASSLKAEHYKK